MSVIPQHKQSRQYQEERYQDVQVGAGLADTLDLVISDAVRLGGLLTHFVAGRVQTCTEIRSTDRRLCTQLRDINKTNVYFTL